MDFESETFIVQEVTHALRGDGFDASEDGTGRGTPIIPILEAGARTGKSTDDPRAGIGIGEPGDPMFTLQGGKQHAVAFDTTQITSTSNYSNPKPGDPRHPLAGEAHPPAVAFRTAGDGNAYEEGDRTAPLTTNTDRATNVLAFQERGREGGRNLEYQEDLAYSLNNPGAGGRAQERNIQHGYQVRRLTVVECARLQGFQDVYGHIERRPRKIDAEEAEYLTGHRLNCWQDGEQWFTSVAADGPMYRAYGNSMAVPCMSWLGMRIQACDEAHQSQK